MKRHKVRAARFPRLRKRSAQLRDWCDPYRGEPMQKSGRLVWPFYIACGLARQIKNKSSRVAFAIAAVAILPACKGERVVAPAAGSAPPAHKSVSALPNYVGFLSANLSFAAYGGWKEYRSPKIPFRTVVANGRVTIPAEITEQLAGQWWKSRELAGSTRTYSSQLPMAAGSFGLLQPLVSLSRT